MKKIIPALLGCLLFYFAAKAQTTISIDNTMSCSFDLQIFTHSVGQTCAQCILVVNTTIAPGTHQFTIKELCEVRVRPVGAMAGCAVSSTPYTCNSTTDCGQQSGCSGGDWGIHEIGTNSFEINANSM